MKLSYTISYAGRNHISTYEAPDHRVLKKRDHLPDILNSLGLIGEGIEIGVLHGEFSETILQDWKGSKLYSIDPWKYFQCDDYMDDPLVSQDQQDTNYEATRKRLTRFGDRSCILRMTSEEAAGHFKDGQLDFIYIDAQHQYNAVKADLALWYPKVKGGGIFGGHDFFDIDHEGKNIFGVRRAVEEMCLENGYEPLVTIEDGSWFIIKSE